VDTTDTGIPAGELIDDIKHAITIANISAATPSDLAVIAVELTLNVLAEDSAGGGLDFRVPFVGMRLRLGAKVTRQDTHTVTVRLLPTPADGHEVRAAAVQRVLVDAIETIRTIIRDAGRGDNPFALDTAAVEMSFVVTREGSISLGAQGELRDEVTHTLKLSVGPHR
jgi:Trypsin-co-occurring domain 2